jgi:hypothetical protein
MSFDSYTTPVAKDGTLPVKLFGRSLNFKRAKEQGIKWLICIAEKDDLVEKESSLAPLDWVEAEVAVFPKGHVAIATSWSLPATECSLDRCFLDYRGPVRFQLDLEAEADKTQAAAAQKVTRDKAQLEADLKVARDKAKPELAAALPASGEKIQKDVPKKPQDEKPRSVATLKAMEGKAEPEAAVPTLADKTPVGQKAEEDQTMPAAAPKQEA